MVGESEFLGDFGGDDDAVEVAGGDVGVLEGAQEKVRRNGSNPVAVTASDNG